MARKTKRMSDVTEEQWLQCNDENRMLVEEFLEYCSSIDRSPMTIRNYRSDLRIIINWFKDKAKNKEFFDITKRDVIKFQNWCITQEMSPARIRRLRSAMSSMSNYIENMLDNDYPNFRNIINKIPAPNLSAVREKTVLSDEQVEFLIDELMKSGEIQKACFIAVLAGSGMRKSEIVQCDMSWYFGHPTIYEGMYVSPEIRTKGRGKMGKKLNKYTICAVADDYLKQWYAKRQELNIDCEALFVTKRNEQWERIKESTVDSWMQSFTKILGVDCYAHCLRHYSATWLKKHSVNIDQIRDFMGHNDSSTSEIYVDIGKEENLVGMLDFLSK
ncbi:integrase/recombinase [Clostridium botulinum C str. Eklund]|nr:integrase/recombinase [Clostridium botulinum C str. Eklund]